MKKLIALLLALACVFSFAACAAKTTETEDTNAPTTSEDVADTQTPENEDNIGSETDGDEELPGMDEPAAMPEEGAEAEFDEDFMVDGPAALPEDNTDVPAAGEASEEGESAVLELMNSIWALYTEDEKFPAAGGDYSEMVEDGAGKVSLGDASNVEYLLTFPADDVAKLDGAASILHMMNANTFTSGAFHVANTDDVAAIAENIHTLIANKQWMCGFPEQLIIAVSGNLIVSAYGNLDLITTFRDKLLAADASFTLVYDEAIIA